MALIEHALIITVNRRLAREMSEQYSDQKIAAGQQVWETPEILPWSSWLNSLWRQTLNTPSENPPFLLLNKLQARAIWEAILRASEAANGLLQIGETTRAAMEAWRLIHEYDLNLKEVKALFSDQNVDTRTFYEWASAYQQKLKENNWIDQALMPVKLFEQFEADQLSIPEQVLMAGFDELTPQQIRLINLLMSKKCSVLTHQPESKSAKVSQLTCKDFEHELQFSAARARYLLEQNPQATVGIVVPDLHKRKIQIQAVFEDILIPDRIFPGSETTSPFNISLGDSLTSFAVIKTALQILTAANERLSLEELSRLIRSPFIGGSESELSKRSLLDAQLRQFGDDSIGLSLVIREASDEESNRYCPLLVEALQKLQAVAEEADLTKNRSIVEWVELFDMILESMAWPGERQVSSVEYQTIESWRSAREQCVSLDMVSKQMKYSSALQHLRKTASEQTFQAEGSDVPIQILGVLEAAGLEFDHMMVLGMTDEQWPAKPAPNPFLPLQLQRQKKMTHATAEVELQSARVMTDRLLESAPEIIFMYPNQQADQALRPSPLIKDFPKIEIEDIAISPVVDLRQKIMKESSLEKLIDSKAKPLPDNVVWNGGVGIFKDQAACPFRAFVRHRLRSHPLGMAESGLNPAERGSLVHDALEILWKALQTHDRLIKISPERLREVIRSSVEVALKEFHSGKTVLQETQFQSLEIDRLEKLLTEWLDVERQREPFSVIACEEEMELHLGGISVKTRVDRIDQLEGGELALIDYKTGDVSTKSWEGERPDEPQLPVYAVGMRETPKAILFAKVKKGEQTFVGLSDDLNIGKIQENWNEMILVWRENLEKLAGEFVHGNALVDPKDSSTCQYCTYQSLCRIDEVREFSDSMSNVVENQ